MADLTKPLFERAHYKTTLGNLRAGEGLREDCQELLEIYSAMDDEVMVWIDPVEGCDIILLDGKPKRWVGQFGSAGSAGEFEEEL